MSSVADHGDTDTAVVSDTPVWVVTRWCFGGGGDDDRQIIGVFTTSEKAHAAAESGDEIMVHPLDPESLINAALGAE